MDENRELMYNISLEGEKTAGDVNLNYFLTKQANGLEKEYGFENTYGVMIEESCHNAAIISEINDLCPIKEEVVEFINSLQRNRVTSTTLHDVAQDWVTMRH